MDVLRQVALFGVVYLFLMSWCMHYFFPKKIIAEMDDDLLLFFERKFRVLRNIALALLLLFPPFLGVAVEMLPKELKLGACSVGIIIALSSGFSFVEFRSYLSFIRNEKMTRDGAKTGTVEELDSLQSRGAEAGGGSEESDD